ncbi:ArsC family reductase [Thalassolituus sp.]|uniref:ArsC family reductase n=1 Tax=Thalassolituus sp. TaxID=2030822 RepID=UPI00260AC3AA|nr:ArsC family reductase [uncultured Thalassolituus sp.]TNC92514.1 MAG: ArsC family reductase [Thalassolituus sp.]
MFTLYGIKNCDTMKKAMKWLDEAGISYHFHDYKKEGLPETLLDSWLSQHEWDELINRRGTTWRKLDDNTRENMDTAMARQVMLENPSIIKRPLLDTGSERILGFKADDYAARFK